MEGRCDRGRGSRLRLREEDEAGGRGPRSAAVGTCGGCGDRRLQVGPGASVARARQVRLAAARACGTRRVGPRAWARGERGLGRGKGHCWLGRLGLDEGEAGPVQGKGEGRGGRAEVFLLLGFLSISYSLLFLIQTSLNSNTNLNSNHTQLKVCTSMNAQQNFLNLNKF